MTRQAVEAGFERFLDDMIQTAYREFDVVRAMRGGGRSGSRVINRLLKRNEALDRRVVRPELNRYRDLVLEQFRIVLDYAEDPDAEWAAYTDEVLEANLYYRSLRDDLPAEYRAEIRETLLEQQRRLAEAAIPLVDSAEPEFWAAVEAEFTREQAVSLIEDRFAFTGPLETYRDAFVFAVEIDPAEILSEGPGALFGSRLPTVTVEFTDEAARTMLRAERRIIRQAKREVDSRFDAAA